MNNTSGIDKEFSIRRCFKCNAEIDFTSKEAKTPSGKPTMDQSTGKVIPLDPATKEYHECKPEDLKAFKQTDEYRTRISEWLSKQQSNQNTGSTSATNGAWNFSSIHHTTNDSCNNYIKPILDKILARLDHIYTLLGNMHTDTEEDIADIQEKENQVDEKKPPLPTDSQVGASIGQP